MNATNVQTGKLLRFSRPYMADYTLGMWLEPKTSLADAVAASSYAYVTKADRLISALVFAAHRDGYVPLRRERISVGTFDRNAAAGKRVAAVGHSLQPARRDTYSHVATLARATMFAIVSSVCAAVAG